MVFQKKKKYGPALVPNVQTGSQNMLSTVSAVVEHYLEK
jgi:hypothetical protein